MRENDNIQDTNSTKITTITVSKQLHTNNEVGQMYAFADDLTVGLFKLKLYPWVKQLI